MTPFPQVIYFGLFSWLLQINGLFYLPANKGWSVIFDGSGSNPVINNGVLFIGSADGSLYAFVAETGKMKWKFQTGGNLSSGATIVAMPADTDLLAEVQKQVAKGMKRIDMTSTVEDGMVYFGSGDKIFYALDAETGEKIWSYEAGTGMASKNNTSYQVPAPLVRNGSVYFITDDGLHALDAGTGDRRWIFDILKEIPAETHTNLVRMPSYPVFVNSTIYLTARPFRGGGAPSLSYVFSIDAETGTANWITSLEGTGIGTPIVSDGVVCVDLWPTLLALNTPDGKVRWRFEHSKRGERQIHVSGNMIFLAAEKTLMAVNIESGQELWTRSVDNIENEIHADQANLYVINYKEGLAGPVSTIRVFTLSTGEEQWSLSFKGSINDIAIKDGIVFASGNSLHAINLRSGKKLWSFHGNGSPMTKPTIHNGKIYTATPKVDYFGTGKTKKGHLYAIDLLTGKL